MSLNINSVQHIDNNHVAYVYQTFAKLYKPISEVSIELPKVPGFTFHIESQLAYAMNIISKDQALKDFDTLVHIFRYQSSTAKHPSYSWHMCLHCAMYACFFLDNFVAQKFPDNYILQDVIRNHCTNLFEQLDKAIINQQQDSLDQDICSYGQCYSQTIFEIDPWDCPPETKQLRINFVKTLAYNLVSNTKLFETKSLEISNLWRKANGISFDQDRVLSTMSTHNNKLINKLFLQ